MAALLHCLEYPSVTRKSGVEVIAKMLVTIAGESREVRSSLFDLLKYDDHFCGIFTLIMSDHRKKRKSMTGGHHNEVSFSAIAICFCRVL